MPGPFRLRPRADELQPLGIVRQIHVDEDLLTISLFRPRTHIQRAAMDILLDRRLRIRPAPSCERCEQKIAGEPYEVQPGTGGLVVHVHCPGVEGGSFGTAPYATEANRD
jgi:hypothetical protein